MQLFKNNFAKKSTGPVTIGQEKDKNGPAVYTKTMLHIL